MVYGREELKVVGKVERWSTHGERGWQEGEREGKRDIRKRKKDRDRGMDPFSSLTKF